MADTQKPSDLVARTQEQAIRAWAKVESNVRVVLASSNVELSLESHERPQGGIYAKGIGSVFGTTWRPREIRSAAEFEQVVLGALRTPPSPEDRALALAWYAGLEAAGRPTTPPAPEVTEAMEIEAMIAFNGWADTEKVRESCRWRFANGESSAVALRAALIAALRGAA